MAEEIPEEHVVTQSASLFTVHSGERTWYLAVCDSMSVSTSGLDRATVIKDLMEFIALSHGIAPSQVAVRDKPIDEEG